MKPIGDLLSPILRKVAADQNAQLLRANEARLAGNATEEQIALLEHVRAKHGAPPLDADQKPRRGRAA